MRFMDIKKSRVKKYAGLLAAAVLLTGVASALSGCAQADQDVFGEGAGITAATESVEAEENGRITEPEEAGGETENFTGEEERAAEAPADGEIQNEKERVKVRGIYVTGPMAGTANMDALIDLVDRTELNTMVIDIKNDEGYVVCDMDAKIIQEVGSVRRYVRDMPALVQKCKEKDIYLIARIVAFKDPVLAEAKPEWCLHKEDGTVFLDKSGQPWLNPYEKEVWEYLTEVAGGAVDLGFDEVQFDYIRFSTDSGMEQVDFGDLEKEASREEIIAEFAAYAVQKLHDKGAFVSADVYGSVIDSEVDQQIVGQDYLALAECLDYISPMVYPSHYGANSYRIPVPDAQPYETVLSAMQASKKALAGMPPMKAGEDAEEETVSANAAPVSGNAVSESPDDKWKNMTAEEIAVLEPLKTVQADVRPWLQDFTASWVKGHISYGPEQIRAQIQAVYDAGYEEWILWNAANRYTEDGLNAAERPEEKTDEQPEEGGA
ncbi:MAG: putative glycoside hydrolase [Eubacteriales bacterium]|nr:putative glycoside hydrolase [Eubacteriales bacterium]